MGFSDRQVKALGTKLNGKHVKTREVRGKTLSYVEGWHVIDEANRVFGFDVSDVSVSMAEQKGTTSAV